MVWCERAARNQSQIYMYKNGRVEKGSKPRKVKSGWSLSRALFLPRLRNFQKARTPWSNLQFVGRAVVVDRGRC